MRLLVCTIVGVLVCSQAAFAELPAIHWSEDFSTDPIVGGRFLIPQGNDPARFTYDSGGHFLTVHYDTQLPTAWCTHAIDPMTGRGICRTRDFDFEVTFRIRSAGFFADPDQFAQIGWGLVNSTATGSNRAGAVPPGPPYAFDAVSFDFFPNVSPSFGGPTLAGTVIHSDQGAGFFAEFEFPFGAESRIDTAFGDETIPLDTVCTAKVSYSAQLQTLTMTVQSGMTPLLINADGSGGPGGPDADPATIQTFLFADEPFSEDRFALTAWQDSFNLAGSSVKADVDIFNAAFTAPPSVKADMNDDGSVDGLDIPLFVDTVLSNTPEPMLVTRADMNFDAAATLDDVPRFVEALLCP